MNGGMSAVLSGIRHADLILDWGKSFRLINTVGNNSYAPALSFDRAENLVKHLHQITLPKEVILISGGNPSLLLPEDNAFDITLYPAFLPHQYVCRSLEGYPFNIHFTMPKVLHEFMEQNVPGYKVIHESELYIRHFKNLDSVIFAVFTENVVSLLFKSPIAAVAYDQITYKSAEDVLYFLLYYAKSLKMDPSAQKLIVSGDISVESALCRHLRIYFDALEYIPLLPEEMTEV